MTYIATSLITREALSDPAVSIAGREPTRGPHVYYCYSTALQNGSEYVENCISFKYNIQTMPTQAHDNRPEKAYETQ